MHEPPHIPVERLRDCLRERYAIAAATLDHLPLGHDYCAAVYRVVSDDGETYLLKATSRPLYEPGCLIPRYLNEQGLSTAVAPIPTTGGSLWTSLAEWTLIVYPFLVGETTWAGMTDDHWRQVGAIFRRLHQIPLPPAGAGFESLRAETFDPTDYARWVHMFEAHHLRAPHGESGPARDLRASWRAHRPTIHAGLTALEQLGAELRARALPHVICHADLHPANLLRTPTGRVFVLDWDEVMLAPKERDFIFIWSPQADAFWTGYGQHETDWSALAYFQWERVIQDVIEEARQVLGRDNVDEASRASAAQQFEHIFVAGGTVKAALAAQARCRETSAPPRDSA